MVEREPRALDLAAGAAECQVPDTFARLSRTLSHDAGGTLRRVLPCSVRAGGVSSRTVRVAAAWAPAREDLRAPLRRKNVLPSAPGDSASGDWGWLFGKSEPPAGNQGRMRDPQGATMAATRAAAIGERPRRYRHMRSLGCDLGS
jgi:hypothetical protein